MTFITLYMGHVGSSEVQVLTLSLFLQNITYHLHLQSKWLIQMTFIILHRPHRHNKVSV